MKIEIAKTTVELNFYFVAAITLLLLAFPQGRSISFFLFCILHEVGHLTAMCLLKQIPKKIELNYFGMKIVGSNGATNLLQEAVILSSGPFVNLMLAGLFLLLNNREYSAVNLVLAAFNLLPIGLLDGGRLLLLFFRESSVRKIGLTVSVFLIITGAVVAIKSRSNFTILIVSIYTLAAQLTGKN